MEEKIKPRIGYARRTAREIIARLNIEYPPVLIQDVVSLLRRQNNIKIMRWELGGIDGIQGDDGDNVSIAYNDKRHPHRKRFTVAHELGHMLLGHTNARSNEPVSLDSPDINEQEANQFAAELLVPMVLLKKDIAGGQNDIKALANKRYWVSEEMMWRRLQNCRLLEKIKLT